MKWLPFTAFFIYAFTTLLAAADSARAQQILRREADVELQSCDTGRFTEGLPQTTAYLQAILGHIVSENPEVFHGDLAPEHICIGVKYRNGTGRAWAVAERRTITIDHGLILRVQNDAQLAFVISHELAHVSMRHIHINPEAESTQDEAEADRVGAHFYLKAGFVTAELAWRQQQIVDVLADIGLTPGQLPHSQGMAHTPDGVPLVHAPPPNISASERIANAYSACGVTDPAKMQEPDVGVLRYPSECWTIWDIRHGEPARSPTYRTLMNDERSITSLNTSPGLQTVKTELENYVEVNPADDGKWENQIESPEAPPPKLDSSEEDN